jgi:hypothetical protein
LYGFSSHLFIPTYVDDFPFEGWTVWARGGQKQTIDAEVI